MKAVKSLLKFQETKIGLVTAFAFLLIFFCIWMTAYNGITDRADNLKIGFVNEDGSLGLKIKETLVQKVPFDMQTYSSLQDAKQEMNERNLDMVILIPKDFSQSIQTNEEAKIEYFINQANASMAKQIMDNAAQNITKTVNENIYSYKQQVMLQNGSGQLTSLVPSQELTQVVSQNITQIVQSLNVNTVQSSVQKTNNAEGFAVTMVPMMMILASFVGSMIMSMNINIAAMKLKNTHGRWSIFSARLLLNLGASLLLSLLTILLMLVFNIEWKTSMLQTWIFQTFVFFSFISLTQMFVIVFGTGGMVFNIIFLSIQLVTSGVMVPKVMLPEFYQTISASLPATYAANGYYTVIFGGKELSGDMNLLLIISGITLLIAAVRLIFQKKAAQKSKVEAVNPVG
ncbi:YhgE/Pip domain-containing protein [Bacillus benzoevorans]|uniref:Putative phage infection (PIP) family protein YhgE n=1 Tax=Bacillus benzoevorans TaxID=1456 RepID=A0A7X0LTX3_9BACI|nr:ABC transporter permease [Bacillus benzoevorans]MBB6443953.1 putative phage infection (PIP) family protein YhgE [Bacillus benzoevorans]